MGFASLEKHATKSILKKCVMKKQKPVLEKCVKKDIQLIETAIEISEGVNLENTVPTNTPRRKRTQLRKR